MKVQQLTRAARADDSFGAVEDALDYMVRGRITAWHTSSATASGPTVVTHDLGAVPDGYVVIGTRGSTNYFHIEEDEARWTASQIVIRCAAAGNEFRLIVVAQD